MFNLFIWFLLRQVRYDIYAYSPHIRTHNSFQIRVYFYPSTTKVKDLYKFTSFPRQVTYGRASFLLTKHYLSQPLLQLFLSFTSPNLCKTIQKTIYLDLTLTDLFTVDKDSAA